MSENSEWQKKKVEEWKKEMEEKQDKSLKIKVETDGDVLKEVATENAELRQKVGQQESKKPSEGDELLNELKSKIENRYLEHGLAMPTITDKDSLEDATANLAKIQKLEQNQREATGQSTLEGNGYDPDGQRNRVGFTSVEQQIDSVRDRAS